MPVVFAQEFVATPFFGWPPMYLAELFPARDRAASSGIAYNVGRFATGALFAAVGASCGLIDALGPIAIWWAPDTSGRQLDD